MVPQMDGAHDRGTFFVSFVFVRLRNVFVGECFRPGISETLVSPIQSGFMIRSPEQLRECHL